MLADCIGKQVRLEGVYNGKDIRFSNRYAVVLEDVRVFDLAGNELEWLKDHTWVQEAWLLKDLQLKRGDKLSFIATARSYRNKKGEVGIGFADPKAIECQPFVL